MIFSYFIFGFLIGSSLIFAIGPQNIFVIEQGLKKEFTFWVCLICSISDGFLICLGIFIFTYYRELISPLIELILNLSLIIFLIFYIYNKFFEKYENIKLNIKEKNHFKNIILKTLGFTFLNPHVYSDTVYLLGNISKNYSFFQKCFFGFGATLSSFVFFFSIGYLSMLFSKNINNHFFYRSVNIFIIIFMTGIIILVFNDLYSNLKKVIS